MLIAEIHEPNRRKQVKRAIYIKLAIGHLESTLKSE